MFKSIFQDPVRYSDFSIKLWRNGGGLITNIEGAESFMDFGYKISSKTNKRILRFFIIKGHLLAYTRSRMSSRVKGTLDLRNLLVSITGFCIVISYGAWCTRLEAVNFESLILWRKALAPFVVFIDFPRVYNIGKQLGAGSFGTVYQVQSNITGEILAAKITTKKAYNGTISNISRQEVLMLRKLKHQNIITLHEVHENVECIMIVMEFIEGKRINKFVRELRINDFVQRENLLHQLLEVLSYLSEQKMTHRDLKPANILVSTQGRVKILDFGLAFNGSIPPENSRTGGTPGFLAPEIFNSENENDYVGYTAASDMYAIGLVYYELVTGVQPFFQPPIPITECNKRGIIPLKDENLLNASLIEKKILKRMLDHDYYRRIDPKSARALLNSKDANSDEFQTTLTSNPIL